MYPKHSHRRQFLKQLPAIGTPMLCSGSLLDHLVFAPNVGSKTRPNAAIPDAGQTWIKIDGHIYGAKADDRGPIGGGEGYRYVFSANHMIVRDRDALIRALAVALPGDVIVIPGDVTIDLTTYVYIDSFALEIPAGVTLASDRGYNGSQGALITSDALKTDPLIQILGSNVHISGLRIQGPNGKRHMEHHAKAFDPGGKRHDYYYKFPVSVGVETVFDGLEVDNCELSAFSRAAISLKSGGNHHIHHCFIHHCQYNGLGYGISHDVSNSKIAYNLFDHNRHSIAGTGRAGSGYIAQHNVELGISLSHCFDMHGGNDRKDGTTIAGEYIDMSNNTFWAPQHAIGIRGAPERAATIERNWFVPHISYFAAIKGLDFSRILAKDNAFGMKPTKVK
ncbi:MAG: hypothetical protein HKN87_17405 [Saprospiraceae bacterium]|nr:hypothetical protein [Saprospiraceae bacterium]